MRRKRDEFYRIVVPRYFGNICQDVWDRYDEKPLSRWTIARGVNWKSQKVASEIWRLRNELLSDGEENSTDEELMSIGFDIWSLRFLCRRTTSFLYIPGYNIAFHSLFTLYLPLVFLVCTSGMRDRIQREIYWRGEMKDTSRDEIRSNGKILPRYFSIVGLWEATWHSMFNLHPSIEKYPLLESILYPIASFLI